MVVLDVINQTSQPFHLVCTKEEVKSKTSLFSGSATSFTIDPFCVRRILVGVKRMDISPDKMPPIDSSMRKYLTKEKHLTEAQFDKYRALQVYRDKLIDQISILWHSATDNCNGILRLDGFQLADDQLSRLQKPQVQLAIRASMGDKTESEKFQVKIHSLLKLEANLTVLDSQFCSDDFRVSLIPLRLLSESSLSWVSKIKDNQLKENSAHFFSVPS